MNDNRKPILVAIICVIVAVILLAVGIGFQGQAGGAAKQIVNMLRHLGGPLPICSADASDADGACTIAAYSITAAHLVTPLAGGFALSSQGVTILVRPVQLV
jgi:hypothetical protein